MFDGIVNVRVFHFVLYLPLDFYHNNTIIIVTVIKNYKSHIHTCGTAKLQLDIYTHVTLELFNKFVELLASYMWALIQYHNSILNTCKWCTHKVHYSRATYCTLHVNCSHGHHWIILPLILDDGAMQYIAVIQYLPVFYRLFECQHLLNRCVACAKLSFFILGQ